MAHQWKSEAYPDPSWTSKIGLFAKIVNRFHPLTIFAKSSILDVQLGSEYTFESSVLNLFPIRTAATGLTNLPLYVTMYSIMDYLKFIENRPYNFKFFKGCLSQNLIGPFLNTLSYIPWFWTQGDGLSLQLKNNETPMYIAWWWQKVIRT